MTTETNLPKTLTAKNKPGTIVTHFTIREHEITCDEMPLYGGNDEAPDPWDLIIAGAAGCSAISLRQFAQQKGWDIGEIGMKLSYDLINGEHVVQKEISLTGQLSKEQQKVLLRVAHCGAEKMLEGGMKFVSTLVK
jgi:putative redox protein